MHILCGLVKHNYMSNLKRQTLITVTCNCLPLSEAHDIVDDSITSHNFFHEAAVSTSSHFFN